MCLKTHLPVMMWALGGRGTRVHVLLACKASNSRCIAANQFGSLTAERTLRGTGKMAVTEAVMFYFMFGLWTSARARVTMGWRNGSGSTVVAGEAAGERALGGVTGVVTGTEVSGDGTGRRDAVGVAGVERSVREERARVGGGVSRSTRRGGDGAGAVGHGAVMLGVDGGGAHGSDRTLVGAGATTSRRGKTVSSKTTWRDVMTQPVSTMTQRYPW